MKAVVISYTTRFALVATLTVLTLASLFQH